MSPTFASDRYRRTPPPSTPRPDPVRGCLVGLGYLAAFVLLSAGLALLAAARWLWTH